ncbi:hypothetical protein ABZX30_28340 [Streptomyces sp. NPDC004542]|uniref:hypothetical protein n=1 Tax=Streptomyces sp. NPDC004542 TaxID=3154281 RepID=UPI0033BC0DF0
MSRRKVPAGAWITGLLVTALAVVFALSQQARNGIPDGGLAGGASPEPSVKASRSAAPKPPQYKVPADSGTGRRVVYSLGQQRVWLVGADGKVQRTFGVWPGTVAPAKGAFRVTFRRETGVGSDGVRIENAVYFGTANAFSNAVDGSSPSPAPGLRTGAVRERATDGKAMWDFATTGTAVQVVG